MKAMILAAGRGERMRPLTDKTPKPLLKVHGKALIEYHLSQLAALGVREVVINHAWLGEQIVETLGCGKRYGLSIHYSDESNGALETAGGIIKALPLLVEHEHEQTQTVSGSEPFVVINGDIFLTSPLTELPTLPKGKLAHLLLVANPEHNQAGDFYLANDLVANKLANKDLGQRLTFSGIAVYHPGFFSSQVLSNDKLPLAPMLRAAAEQGLVSGQLLTQGWVDVGTPERLAQLNSN